MSNKKKSERRLRTKRVIRQQISGTSERPRLSVFRSNVHIYAQLVDDQAGHTVAAASSQAARITGLKPIDLSRAVGKLLAESARERGIEAVVFDRNGYRYHGRVKALAEGAREGGLKF